MLRCSAYSEKSANPTSEFIMNLIKMQGWSVFLDQRCLLPVFFKLIIGVIWGQKKELQHDGYSFRAKTKFYAIYKKMSFIYTHTFTRTSEAYNFSNEEVFQHTCTHTLVLRWTLFLQMSGNNTLYNSTLNFQIIAGEAEALQWKFLIFNLIHEVCHLELN